ncbi:hypothetical protein IX84_20025 [Phaeodactylibacter xiamenensis]|uniref:Uncharacterized protein n=1 Tax=Phaeodactylibacter xiamenensis TaxID=1524460 RepID=A0A098S3Q1_9BACT|nr:hypothetical protein IX84_20025 [Phaeodactylibacter xiamenensis]
MEGAGGCFSVCGSLSRGGNLNLGWALPWTNLNLSPARGEAKVGLWRVLARMRLSTLHKATSAGEEPGDGCLVRPFAAFCRGARVGLRGRAVRVYFERWRLREVCPNLRVGEVRRSARSKNLEEVWGD